MNRQVLEDLRQQGYAPKSLLDVGAHVGTFTQEFREVFPGCVPTLIEPNPFCQESLAKLSFEQHAVAASHETGRAELFLTKEWLQSTGSSLYRENTHFFRDDVVVKREVDKVRLDDLFRGRRFDFVKIDTQGSELDVLRGGETVLRQADYILLEISLVEYNIGGARAEAVFAQLAAMGFHPVEVTDFHRLKGVHNGNLLQMDFLFARRSLQHGGAPRRAESDLTALRKLAGALGRDGKPKDALVLLEHLDAVQAGNVETLQQLVRMLGADGQILKAIEKLATLKLVATDAEALLEEVRALLPAAIERFNGLLAAGQIAEAGRYADALSAIIPGNPALLNSALSCSVALGRMPEAVRHATALLRLDPAHAGAHAVLAASCNVPKSADSGNDQKVAQALSPANGVHPLIRLRDIHDAASLILCRPLDGSGIAQVEQLLAAARDVVVDVPAGSEWEGWATHYRLAIDALDLPVTLGPTPEASKETSVSFATSAGKTLDWKGVQAAAKRLGAQTVFFAAADRGYVDLYARWYIKSVLKYCDVKCVVVVHVIGGAAQLKDVAKSLDIHDERLILAGDDFDAKSVATKCYDTPPKGLIAIPVAHFQSVRFLRLGTLLQKLKLPVFVSDIDLLLQRGVRDLLDRCASEDVVINENSGNTNAGSRLTANLLLVNPTDNAALFLRFMKGYLERALSKRAVSRWIDQFALLMARHHLMRRGQAPRIGYFDTNSDINNVMYKSYQAHPFRFLSLYHGFDTSSLESSPEGTARKAVAKEGRVARATVASKRKRA